MKDLLQRVQPVIFILSFILFAWNMQVPDTVNFDEFHYVPAAKELLAGKAKVNREHPPLAKYFIATGIALLGDNADGWRIMSAFFGALCVIAIVGLGRVWGFSVVEQWQLGILATVNGMIFSLARMAMLDIFMMTFSFAAMAFFYSAWLQTTLTDEDGDFLPINPDVVRNRMIGAGICLGLSAACKWSGIYPWALMGILAVFSPLLTARDLAPELALSFRNKILYLLVLPVGCYLLTFVPIWIMAHESMTPKAILDGQLTMFSLQHGLSKVHPYYSDWFTWPVIYRPVWLKFEAVPNRDGWVKASLFIGNIVQAWIGLPLFLWYLWDAIRKPSFIPRVVGLTYFFMWLPWSLLTNRVQFLFYYTPAFIMTTFACVERLREWPRARWALVIGAVICFAYFYPVLAGWSIPSSSFRWWAWFGKWI